MKRLFIDTSAFYALADKNDPAYKKAISFLKTNTTPFITTNFIFAETMSLITKRISKKIALRFGSGILESKIIDIFCLSEQHQKQAWDFFNTYTDKDWDYIDSSCFVVMDQLNINTAFTFDKHFAQKGFQIMPCYP